MRVLTSVRKRAERFIVFSYERTKYGVAIEDAWALDMFFNKTISRGIRILREKNFGYPCTIYDANGDIVYLDPIAETENRFDKGSKIWNEILDDIVAGFEANDALILDYDITAAQRKHLHDVFMNGMALLANNYNGLWW